MRIGHRLRYIAFAVVIAAGVIWVFGVASLYHLIATWNPEIPFDIEVNQWWADGIGHFSVKGFRIYEPGSDEAFIEGNFSVTYSPWRAWFTERQDLTIQGKKISSKYIREFLKGVEYGTDAIGELDAQLTIGPEGSVVVKSASANGFLGEGTAAGSMDKEGILDFKSTWVVSKSITENVAGVLKDLTPVAGNSIVNSNDPTVIECFLQGHVERPSVRLVSDLFQVELG